MAAPKGVLMIEKELKKTEILCMCSGKGGVGKTLFSSCMGYALTRAGLRVLMIDGDLATDGLSLFLLGPDGKDHVDSFAPSNTFAGVISHYSATGKLDFEVRQIFRNGPDDHGVVYDALISGRFLYGQGVGSSYLSAIPAVDRGTFRSAVRELFDSLRRAGEYDYVIVDTRGGFSFESTDLSGLADSFIVVVEADPTSFYQTRNLVQRIDEAAGESESKSVLRGFLVNKAVDGLSEAGGLDLSRVEWSFRNALIQQFEKLKFSDTYPIPADLQVLQSYKDQMVPFLGSPASLFTYATLTAYSNIFQIVISRWTRDQVQGWQDIINSVAEAIKRRNEEAELTKKDREAEEAEVKSLRGISAQYEQRVHEQEVLIERLRKEVDLAHAQAAAELSRASAVETLIRSVSPKEIAPAKSPVSLILALLLVATLAAGAFGIWLMNMRIAAAQKAALDTQNQSNATVLALQNQIAALNDRLQPTTFVPVSGSVTSFDGEIVDSSGRPIPGVTVRADIAAATAVTNAKGNFRIAIPKGIQLGQRITITVAKEGYKSFSSTLLVPTSGEYLHLVMQSLT